MNIKTVFLALLLSSGAFAQVAPTTETNTSSAKQNEMGQRAEKKDIDDEITNAKLRAATGSKKTVSLSSSLNYSGASIRNPTSTVRPQLNPNATAADPTRLSGDLAVKYRATDNDNLSLGFGVQFTPSYTKNNLTGEKRPAATNASSPYLDYSRVFRSGEVQNVLSATISKYTLQQDIENKLDYSASLSHTFMMGLGKSKFEVGMGTTLGQDIYSEFVADGSQYSVSINPILEYAISEKASLRTVYRAVTMNTEAQDAGKWLLADETQSLGFGYAVTRDIYVYPNMQWKWNRVATDVTTVGFSTNINL